MSATDIPAAIPTPSFPDSIRRRGLLLVLSSPSGAGKTTITRRLLERDPTLSLSVSVTTPARRGRARSTDATICFIDAARFARMVRPGNCSNTRPSSAIPTARRAADRGRRSPLAATSSPTSTGRARSS